MSRTIIGIARDHSGSMGPVALEACADFNNLIQTIKHQATSGQDIGVFVEEFGHGPLPQYQCSVKNAKPEQVPLLTNYLFQGATPLFDAVMELLTAMSSTPEAGDPNTAFLVMVLTDGENNRGIYTARDVARRIKTLQETDRWTITFRTPKGSKKGLVAMGIPTDNILEWEAGDAVAFQQSAVATTAAVTGYLQARTQGVTRSQSFYHTPDTGALTTALVTASMTDVTDRINEFYLVQPAENGMKIQDFCLAKSGRFRLGEGYYELIKRETLQDGKRVIIEFGHKYYAGTGEQARRLLNLPLTGEIKIQPSTEKRRRIFVQSKAPNRKLVQGQTVIILPTT